MAVKPQRIKLGLIRLFTAPFLQEKHVPCPTAMEPWWICCHSKPSFTYSHRGPSPRSCARSILWHMSSALLNGKSTKGKSPRSSGFPHTALTMFVTLTLLHLSCDVVSRTPQHRAKELQPMPRILRGFLGVIGKKT